MNRFDRFSLTLFILPVFLILLAACQMPQVSNTEVEAIVADIEAESTLDEQLISAVNAEDTVEVGRLLAAGADANAEESDSFFSSPILRTAIMNDNMEITSLLIANGADVNARDSKGNSMLRRAITGKNAEIVNALIEAGADFTALEGDGSALLPMAVQTGEYEIVRMLIDAGANASDEANIAFNRGVFNMNFPGPGIIAAAARGDNDIIELLLENGADVNQSVSPDGQFLWQPLTFAALGNHLETIKLLVKNGAAIDGTMEAVNPLGAALDYPGATQLLIDLGADVNYQSSSGRTHLEEARARGNEEVIQILLEAGAEDKVQAAPVDEGQSEETNVKQEEAPSLATAAVVSTLSNQPGRTIVSARGNHFVVDSVPPLQGPNEEMNPLDALLGAQATCGTFIYETAAQEMQIPINSIATTVQADFNPAGVKDGSVDPRIQAMRIHMMVEGPSTEQLEDLEEELKTRCPVYTTLSRATEIEITHNEEAMSEATEGLATTTAVSMLTNQPGRAIVSARGNHFVIDSVPPLGGPNEERNPMDLLLGALATCGTFVYEKAAQELEMPLDSIVAKVEGDFNPAGLKDGSVDPRLQALRVDMAVSGVDANQAETLAEQFRTRCPIYTTLSRSAPIEITNSVQ